MVSIDKVKDNYKSNNNVKKCHRIIIKSTGKYQAGFLNGNDTQLIMMMSKSERPKLVIFRTIFKEILVKFYFLIEIRF